MNRALPKDEAMLKTLYEKLDAFLQPALEFHSLQLTLERELNSIYERPETAAERLELVRNLSRDISQRVLHVCGNLDVVSGYLCTEEIAEMEAQLRSALGMETQLRSARDMEPATSLEDVLRAVAASNKKILDAFAPLRRFRKAVFARWQEATEKTETPPAQDDALPEQTAPSEYSEDLIRNHIADSTPPMTAGEIAIAIWGSKPGDEAAKHRVREWMREGKLPANRIKRGQYKVSTSALEQLARIHGGA